jgi:hypothetical protein
MAITKEQQYKVSVIPPYKQIIIKERTTVKKDGKQLSKSTKQFLRNPGDDVSNDYIDVQTIANKLWTTDVVNTYKASLS